MTSCSLNLRIMILAVALTALPMARVWSAPAPGTWNPQDGVPGAVLTAAVGAEVFAVETYDDGNGPALYAAGGMSLMGRTRGGGLFRRDGQTWTSIGQIFESETAFCMTIWNGKLVVAGTFTSINGTPIHRVATWDGTAWSALGTGIGAGYVRDLIAHNGDLFATGNFSQAGDSAAACVARWDGAAWHPLGSGLNGIGHALTTFEGDLVVAGTFTDAGGVPAKNVARWDGAHWSAFGAGVASGAVYALEVYDTDGVGPNPPRLIAGGTLCSICSTYLVEWNGTGWVAFAGSVGGAGTPFIQSLGTWNGNLMVGGSFETVGAALPAYRIALWNPATGWSALGTGFSPKATSSVVVHDMAIINGDPVACGTFWNDGRVAMKGIARWSGNAWRSLGTGIGGVYDPYVLALAATDSGLAVAGRFTSVGDAVNANNIALFTAAGWETLGVGTGGGVEANENANVNAVTLHLGQLHLGYETYTLASGWRWGITRWDSAQWITPVSTSGFSSIYALASHNGDLYAGGTFVSVSGTPANRIFRWDGVAPQALGSGLGFTARALLSFNGDLVAGGEFTTAGGNPALRVARWDGTQWYALGAGLSGTVYSLAEHEGSLYAGCTNGVYRWDGSAWNLVGPVTFGAVYAMLSNGGYLYVAGGFSAIPGTGLSDTRHLARWNGTEWQALGTGIQYATSAAQARALAYWDGSIWVGSNMYVAGDSASAYLARWTPDAPSGVSRDNAPAQMRARAYPNPFPSSTRIAYAMTVPGHARVTVFDVQGRRVRELASGWHPVGAHETAWDGRDDSGRASAAGTYFVRVAGAAPGATLKVVMTR